MIESLLRNAPWLQRLLGIPPEGQNTQAQGHLIFPAAWTTAALAVLFVSALLWFGANYWYDGTRPRWLLKAPMLLLRLLAIYALVMLLSQPT